MSLEDQTDDQRNSAALKRLFADPEVGAQARRLYKKVVPEARFPDIELEDKMAAARAETDKEIKDLRDSAQLREIQDRRKENHTKVREAGFDPVAIEKVMVEEGIANYDTAVKYMRAQNASAPPTPASITPIQMPEGFEDIKKNPTKWGREQAFAAINELRAKRQAV